MTAQKTTIRSVSDELPCKKKYESPRQLARQATILAATREMLAEVGYSATTMRDLALKANVAPGTLYNLYRSKDALVIAAVEDLLDDLGERANQSSIEGIERILALCEQMAASINHWPQYAEAMARALFGAERGDALARLLYERSAPLLEQQIQVAIQSGQLRPDIHASIYVRQMQAQKWGIILAWVMGPIDLAEFRSELMRSQIMILQSIATRKGEHILKTFQQML
ncbi:MAG: TetR/AcrR family transcriptional regulator [Gammaproteobacteria bacterium]|nr:TetR/AcrR family transcriptional regulator [Gammaproteobacteria bacterium]MCH1551700.1 TetR/AcrR family transcriptional regulator [Pseudomonadales bacterium]